MHKSGHFQWLVWFLVHPALHAVAGIAGIVLSFVMWHAYSYATLYQGIDGLVGGMMIGSAILLASAGFRLDARGPNQVRRHFDASH